jgi:hypothetical protein
MASGGSIVAGGANDLILNAGESGTPDIYLQSGSSTKVKIEGSNGDLVKVGGVIKGERGTASAPAYSFSDDTDTGMFNIGNTDLGFAVGGSERIRIDSAGNVGIGTSNPDTSLHVTTPSGTKTELNLAQTAVTNYRLSIPASTDALTFVYGANTERMRIDSSGRVGIGRTPSISNSKLEVGGADNVSLINVEASGVTGGMGIGSTGLQFFHGSSAKMRIDSSGNLLVGTTTLQGRITVTATGSTTIDCARTETSTANNIVLRNGNGAVGSIQTSGSSTSYNTSSDQRLKENIADADDAGSKIDAIQVRQYDWKADGSHQDYGMVAQELLEVAPEAVSQGETEEEMMGVDYSKLVPMLIKEIQSLRNRVAQLEE